METDDEAEQETQDGDEAMNKVRSSHGLLMKNIMRLVVIGSIIAIAINILVLLG